MNPTFYHLLAAVWFFSSILNSIQANEAPIRLSYRVNEPVIQRSRVTVEVTTQTPEGPMQTKAFQEAEARVQLDQLPKTTPYPLTITFERLRVGQETNDRKITFDSKSPQTSPFITALSQAIDQPIQVAVGKSLHLMSESQKLKQLMKDLKSMGGFNVQNLLSEMVQQRFALANQPLEAGRDYQQILKQGTSENEPVELTYRIVEISPKEVRAIVDGIIPTTTIPWNQGAATAKVSGSIDGKVVWNRDNGMIYRSRLNYLYRGTVMENGREFPFELRMTHQDVSKAINS